MRLAEALAERKALDARLSSIEGRLRPTPAFRRRRRERGSRKALRAPRLNRRGAPHPDGAHRPHEQGDSVDGRPLADWIAERDVSVRRFNILSGVADRASERIERRSADDVRVVPVIDVVARKHEADALAARIRGIDARIQAANWATELS
mgnify:CR=1 FL=1